MSNLDDDKVREKVIEAVADSLSFRDAALAQGVKSATAYRYLGSHPAFKARVDAARHRARAVALGAEREQFEAELVPVAAPAEVVDAEVLSTIAADAAMVPGAPSCRAVMQELWTAAQDPEDRRSGVALKIVAEIVVAPVARAAASAQLAGLEVGDDPVETLLRLVNRGKPPPDVVA